MNAATGTPQAPEDRFPGFRVLAQAKHWDPVTRDLVLARTEPPGPARFFDGQQLRCVEALVGQLLDLGGEMSASMAIAIDGRLAENETDGWHYDDMPTDADTWRRSISGLDADAVARGGATFADLPHAEQHALLAALHTADEHRWHDLPKNRTWALWLRYACTAYYAHPQAWNEMGWPGPAYPRGYKNIGIDRREPFEVKDPVPLADPTRDRNDE